LILHKLYAATMDGKGREGTYNFFRTTGGSRGQGRAQGQLPLPPRWRRPILAHAFWRRKNSWRDGTYGACRFNTARHERHDIHARHVHAATYAA